MSRWRYRLRALARRAVPQRLFFPLMELCGGTNSAEADPDGLFRRWLSWLDAAGVRISGSRVLEVGSGRYARLGLRFIAAGAHRVTLVDPNARPLTETRHRAMLEADCGALGLDPGDALGRIRVHAADIAAVQPPGAAERVDLAFSHAVLEHAREPERLFRGCRAWCRPGGRTVHLIDLKDHSHYGPFEMLTFGERSWRRWFDPPGSFHLNRWRLDRYTDALRRAGFADVDATVVDRDEAALRAIRPRLAPEFRHLDVETLAVCVALVHGAAPTA